jgi:hypothetical protein
MDDDPAMPVGLLLGGGVLAGLLVYLFARKKGRPSTYDLPPVTPQWIAQENARSHDSTS